MSKLTDKERLDWLTKNKSTLHGPEKLFPCWSVRDSDGNTPRQAIDAAIAAEKAGRKK